MQDPKNRKKIRCLGTIAQLCRVMSSQLRHISTIEKKLLNSNVSPTRPHNMVNFGPLTAEIVSGVWGTPANFNGFRVLAALLHGTLVVGVAALNRGRHIYSAGRPSRWALAHILVIIIRPHRPFARTTYVDAAYCYRLSSVVCRPVCLSH